MRIVFWGMGNTAKMYLPQIERLSSQFDFVAFTDGSQKDFMNELFWEGYKVVIPEKIPELAIDYLCILSIWEWDIRKRIYDEDLFDLNKIISFHEITIINTFHDGLNNCYKLLSENVHPWQKNSIDMWKNYEYLKKNYSYVLCDDKYWKVDVDKKVFFKENIRLIWVLWLQGFEQAPELVKVCVQSLKRAVSEKEVLCLLDETNLSNYIDLPDFIVQKWKNGNISNAHFADLIRLRLLNVYGGVWIDATVYFTGNKLPDYIKSNRLFMFNMKESWKACTEPMVAANWLISAEPENKMLIILEVLLNEYWKKENKAVNYFIFHIFWTIIVECFPEEWNQVETVIRDPAQLLNTELDHIFQRERFEHLKKMSDVHKLSYRGPYKRAGKDSFWAKICEIDRSDMK